MAWTVNRSARQAAIAKRAAAENADDVQLNLNVRCREAAELADAAEVTLTDEGKYKAALASFVALMRAGVKPGEHAKACNLPESNRNKYQRWWTVARAVVSPLTQVTLAQAQDAGNIHAAVESAKQVLTDARIPPTAEQSRKNKMRGLLKSIETAGETIKDVRVILVRFLTGEISDEQALEVAAGAVIVVERKARKVAETATV